MKNTASYNLYHLRKSNGLCVDCGNPLPESSKITRCPACSAKHNERNKNDHKRLIALKICTCCRTEYAEPFKKMCYECGKRSREKHELWLKNQDISEINEKRKIKSKEVYAERKAKGICTRCGKHQALPFHVLCARCNEKHTEYKRLKGDTRKCQE